MSWRDHDPVWLALLGTLFTWGLTAAGSALVFVLHGNQRKVLDFSLGFAGGVMLAASYWSLLAPAIDIVENSSADKRMSFVPVGIGFIAGGMFVYVADVIMVLKGITTDVVESVQGIEQTSIGEDKLNEEEVVMSTSGVRQRRSIRGKESAPVETKKQTSIKGSSWKRILLLIIAITVHNIPEGLAVGVGFGSIGRSPLSTYESACNLALGIGIQNFPEGLAVSLPLKAAGMSTLRSFWYGQLSGVVEPFAGVLGAMAVTIAEPLLPYALAFAAGAMIYVVVDDIIPEAHTNGNGRLSSFGVMIGFLIMMSLDVGLS